MKTFIFPSPGQQRVLCQLRRRPQTSEEISIELSIEGIETEASLVRDCLAKLERKGLVGKRNHGRTKHGLEWFLLDMGGHLVDFIQKHGEMAQ